MRNDRAKKLPRTMLSTLCAVLVALLLTGCGSKAAEEAKEKVFDAKEKVSSEARELADRSKEVGAQAAEKGNEALDQGKQLGQSLFLKGKALSEWSIKEMHDYSLELRDRYGDDINAAGAHVNDLLDKIARDPNEEVTTADKVGRMIVLMIPMVGPTKRYIDARKLYEVGHAEQDEARKQEARREVLIACAEAGLDIGTLGLVGSKVDLVATGADKVLGILRLSRSVNVLVGEDLKTFDNLLDRLIEQNHVRTGVDQVLTIEFSRVVPSGY